MWLNDIQQSILFLGIMASHHKSDWKKKPHLVLLSNCKNHEIISMKFSPSEHASQTQTI